MENAFLYLIRMGVTHLVFQIAHHRARHYRRERFAHAHVVREQQPPVALRYLLQRFDLVVGGNDTFRACYHSFEQAIGIDGAVVFD